MKTLKPLIFKESYYLQIEKKIAQFFFEVIYKDMYSIVKETVKNYYNSKSDLVNAIAKGRVQYINGRFTGSFNAAISKGLIEVGATYNTKTKYWTLPQSNVSVDILMAAEQARSKFELMNHRIIESLQLDVIQKRIREFSLMHDYETALANMDSDFKTASQIFGIIPQFTPSIVANISENYSNNMKLYIKNWSEESIRRLRDKVDQNTFDGFRAENLVDMIQRDFGASKSKAKFLARQETSLLMSQFREQRYKDIGVTEYRWSTSNDERVRDMHRHLDGKKFSWDSPPIVDNKGNRKHPGEDYGCRCVAIPVVNESAIAA